MREPNSGFSMRLEAKIVQYNWTFWRELQDLLICIDRFTNVVGTGRFELPKARLHLAPSQAIFVLRALALRKVGALGGRPL